MKKPLEKDIQLEICNWLQDRGFFFFRFRYMSRFPIKFIPKGLPDIMVLHEGKFLGLEVKVPDYWKRTDSQLLMQEKITRAGGRYAIVTSLVETKVAIYKDDFALPENGAV